MTARVVALAFCLQFTAGVTASEDPPADEPDSGLAEIQAQRKQLLEELARIRRALEQSDARISRSQARIRELQEQLPVE